MTAVVAYTGRMWGLEIPMRPMCENEHRKLHGLPRSRHDRQWRYLTAQTAMVQRFPRTPVGPVDITVTHHRPNRRSLPDVAACAPTAKAAIDGLVDWGMLADDGPDHVVEITYRVEVSGRDALALLIRERVA